MSLASMPSQRPILLICCPLPYTWKSVPGILASRFHPNCLPGSRASIPTTGVLLLRPLPATATRATQLSAASVRIQDKAAGIAAKWTLPQRQDMVHTLRTQLAAWIKGMRLDLPRPVPCCLVDPMLPQAAPRRHQQASGSGAGCVAATHPQASPKRPLVWDALPRGKHS
jgi:hypothetical protein